MAEITVPMGAFRQLAQEHAAQVFESGDAVAMAYGSHLIKAMKQSATRLFRHSIPMVAIGYSGVAKWTLDPVKPKKASR